MELNPFEHSFASKENSETKGEKGTEDISKDREGDQGNGTEQKDGSNKHNLHIPNIATLEHNTGKGVDGISPLRTPGERKLPPLGLSPGGQLGGGLGTPGSNLWNSLLSATSNPNGSGDPGNSGDNNTTHNNTNNNATNDAGGNKPNNGNYNHANAFNGGNNATNNQEIANDGANSQNNAPSFQNNNPNNANMNQFISMLRKSGLTPNESNLRSGLTPGGINHQGGNVFGFNNQLAGLTTPGALLNSPITPGLSTLLGIPGNQNNNQAPQNGVQQNHPQVNGNTAASGLYFNNANHPIQQPVQQQEQQRGQPESKEKQEKRESKKRKRSENSDKSKKQKADPAIKQNRFKEEEYQDADSNNSTNPENTPNDNSNEEGEDSKRKNFLERNRVAASKCRQRKKQLVQKMEDELSFYSTGYRELSAQVSQLRDQLINLRGIVIGHKDCPMLASSVGGFDQLNNIIQLSNYVTQIASQNQPNPSSIPSTIPTTLNSHQDALNSNGGVNHYMLPHNQQNNMAQSLLPLHVTHNSENRSNNSTTTNPSSETITTTHSINYPPTNHQNNNISSHHSLTDLPAAAQATLPHSSNQQPANGDLRAIHSMSNLSGMNNNNDKLQSMNHQNFSLRPVNSMVDLQQQQHQSLHQQPHPHPQTQNYGNGMVDPAAVTTRNMLGMSQPQS